MKTTKNINGAQMDQINIILATLGLTEDDLRLLEANINMNDLYTGGFLFWHDPTLGITVEVEKQIGRHWVHGIEVMKTDPMEHGVTALQVKAANTLLAGVLA